MKDVLDYFGKLLIEEVRDKTIRGFDMRVAGKMRDMSSLKLFEEIQQLDGASKIVEKIIPQIVDLSIHNLLCMIEEDPNVVLQIENENLSEISDGLAGELYTEDGWIQRFSKQRYEET